MKYCLTLMALLILFVGCDKNRPRRGLYWGEFYATDSAGGNFVRYDHGIDISDPSETSLTINGSVMEKKGKDINGQMGYTKAFPNALGATLTGRWKVKSGNYAIEGDFKTVGSGSIFYGNFKMGSY